MSAFADFINYATDDEKKRVYEEVLRLASQRQSAKMNPPCGKEPYEPCDVPCCLEGRAAREKGVL